MFTRVANNSYELSVARVARLSSNKQSAYSMPDVTRSTIANI